jgi:hypothetical protein
MGGAAGWRTGTGARSLLRLADIQHDPNNSAGDHEDCYGKSCRFHSPPPLVYGELPLKAPVVCKLKDRGDGCRPATYAAPSWRALTGRPAPARLGKLTG